MEFAKDGGSEAATQKNESEAPHLTDKEIVYINGRPSLTRAELNTALEKLDADLHTAASISFSDVDTARSFADRDYDETVLKTFTFEPRQIQRISHLKDPGLEKDESGLEAAGERSDTDSTFRPPPRPELFCVEKNRLSIERLLACQESKDVERQSAGSDATSVRTALGAKSYGSDRSSFSDADTECDVDPSASVHTAYGAKCYGWGAPESTAEESITRSSRTATDSDSSVRTAIGARCYGWGPKSVSSTSEEELPSNVIIWKGTKARNSPSTASSLNFDPNDISYRIVSRVPWELSNTTSEMTRDSITGTEGTYTTTAESSDIREPVNDDIKKIAVNIHISSNVPVSIGKVKTNFRK